MHSLILSSTLTIFLATNLVQSKTLARRQAQINTTTRYWDCCKPSCAWSNKAPFSAPVSTCDKNDNPLSDGGSHTSGCDGSGGTASGAFTCSSQQPWAVDDGLAYGFAAVTGSKAESDTCCACYQLTFTTGPVVGKKLIVQATNIGYDVSSTQFDLAIPGGGVGAFPQGCNAQYQAGTTGWGQQYGGVSSREQCSQLPSRLQPGCQFRFDWLKGADNPSASYERVKCPAALTAKTGCVRNDDGGAANPASAGPSGGSSSGSKSAAVGSSTKASQVTAKTTPTTTTTTVVNNAATAAQWGQCGGQNWTGPTKCPAGNTCQALNPYYSQCLPASDNKAGSSPSTTKTGSNGAGKGTQTLYGQCGGQGWTGPTQCATGVSCKRKDDYYSQCL